MLLLIPSFAQAAESAAANVFAISGNAAVRRSAGEEGALKVGEELFAGDLVSSATNSSAKLLLPDRSIVDVAPETSFRVEEVEAPKGGKRSVTMSVDYGRVRASVNEKLKKGEKFQIRTKSSMMAVRGTEAVVESRDSVSDTGQPIDSKMTLAVVEGLVEVSDPKDPKSKPVQVKRGQRLSVTVKLARNAVLNAVREAVFGKEAAARMKLEEMSDGELETVVTASRVQDQTFRQWILVSDAKAIGQGGNHGQDTIQAAVQQTRVPEVAPVRW